MMNEVNPDTTLDSILYFLLVMLIQSGTKVKEDGFRSTTDFDVRSRITDGYIMSMEPHIIDGVKVTHLILG